LASIAGPLHAGDGEAVSSGQRRRFAAAERGCISGGDH
jgi:hypothetical protein